MNNKLLKSVCLVAASSMLPLSQAALAEDSVQISGWINEGITFYDDGEGSDAVVVSDNGTTLGSRITFSGSADLPNSGLSAGFEVILEPQAANTPLVNANQATFDDTNNYNIDVLGSSVHIGGAFGKVTVGMQSMPTDNIAVLADPSLTLWSGISPVFRGNNFTIQDTGNIDAVWGDFLNCMVADDLRGSLGIGLDCNGIYRGGVRYDLPAFGPVSVAIGYANDDVFDIAAKYTGQWWRLNSILHAGYAVNQGGYEFNNTEVWENSENFQVQLGLMDPDTGIFGTFAYQTEEADLTTLAQASGIGDDTDAYYFKVGIKKGWLSVGDTAIYGEYGSYNDQYGVDEATNNNVTGSEVERFGFSVDQYFGSKLILYGKYENLDLDVDGTNVYDNAQDLDLFTTGLTFFF